MLTPDAIRQAVDLLIAARGDHRKLDTFPEACRPATVEEGYAIQEAFVAAWQAAVAGYKIGATTPEVQKVLGTPGPFAGRVFAPVLLASPARVPAKAFHRIGIEPELAFTLARDLPASGAPYAPEAVADAVAALHPAIEIVDGRWNDPTTVGGPSLVADNGAQGGLVLGPGRADWRTIDLPAAKVALRFGTETVAEGTGAAVMGNPFDALVWLANDLTRRGFGLKARDAVTTGTMAGIKFAAAGMRIAADFGAIGTAALVID